MDEVVIVSAVRTAIGNFNGSLAAFSATQLGGIVIREVLERAKVRPEEVDEVIMGNVLQAGLGQNPARQAAIQGGVPFSVPGVTINKVCGSGLKAVTLAAQAILAQDADVVVAGGMESMTNAPYLLESRARWGYRMGQQKVVDEMIQDGLWCAFNDYHMGVTAENIAEKFHITREMQDEAAVKSQEKACRAIEEGAFAAEIVPIPLKTRRGEVLFDQDEYPRSNVTLESIAALRPAFKPDGTVTAANASGINDGAAAVVVMSKRKCKELGLTPLVTLRSYGVAGVDPKVMGLGPVPATRKALAKAGLTVDDLDLIEANEAFAAQSLAVGRELGFDEAKVNIHGGAIALGHPIGASGARILVSLIYAMKQRNVERGLATLCIGGGEGIAAIVEREKE